MKLLLSKEKEMRELAVMLYKYDYLDADEVTKIMNGEKLDKSSVREFDYTIKDYVINF
jgi:ATP-dependent Zn protease